MAEHQTKTPLPIVYEIDGPEDGEAILMLNGLGMQLTQWPADFVAKFHEAGFRTVRVDNRDVGLSGRVEGKTAPNPYLQLIMRLVGVKTSAPYRLEDMAEDAKAVLDDAGIDQAHVLGLSMGGIISQVFAGLYPDRTKTLNLLMTTSGNRMLPRPKGEAAKILMSREPAAASVDEAVDQIVEKWKFFMTKDGGMSEEELRAMHKAAIIRGADPMGWQRQMAAILETGDVRPYSRRVTCPTVIVHGEDDPLVPFVAGQDIHKTIAHARFHGIPGMGHDLAPIHVPNIGALIIENLKH